ncbi:MAG: class I SAM-dependent methyltransferase [Prolixibacteraceae bacterium]|nr:class I SAM-dependent methyltransferase [Prolixibacteraceae bacterium]
MKRKKEHNDHGKQELNFFQSLVNKLSGNKFRCNVCGSTFNHFKKKKAQSHIHYRCPRCRSDESLRSLWFYLSNEIIGKKNKKIFLVFGKNKLLVKKLKDFGITPKIVGTDYITPFGNKKTKILTGNIYDVIILSHVLQFVDDDQLVYSELKRLLRPGGIALIQTATNPEMDRTYENIKTSEDIDRLKEHYEPGYLRIYGANFSKHLTKAGFDVEVVDYAGQLGPHARRYYQVGRSERELIFICKKNINK